ncbi:hypothetical protein ACQP2H_31745 (plasmid) [Micromonospora sp. CA-248260]|uniref:hypothetical protein n=1 Tax=Micromonospora sp. CA-248260 TaxID=3239962 RepID=UPI003D8C7E61
MQNDTTALAPTPEPEQVDAVVPAPDLSVLAAEQPPAEQGKDDKAAKPEELTETTPASVGLVVALVVISVVAAVVVAMWMVSPLMALLLGAGLIVVAVLAGAGWLAWRKYTRRAKTGGKTGRDGSGRGGRPHAAASGGRSLDGGKKPGGKSGGLWPFGRGKTPAGGGKSPAGGGKPPAGGKPTGDGGGKKKPTGDKSGGLWPFGRGKTPAGGGKSPAGGGKPPAGGKPTGDGGGKKPSGDKSKGGLWPFGRTKTPGGGKAPASDKTPAGSGKAPTSGKTPGGGGKPAGDGGGKPTGGRKAKTAGGAALLGLVGLVRAAKKAKTGDGKAAADKPAGAEEPVKATTRPSPGGHRPETVIDVDVEDIFDPPGRPGATPTSGPTGRSAPRTEPFYDPGPTAGSGWWDRKAPTPLRTTEHQTPVVFNHLGGPAMSTTTSSVDQDAMRVANRYAGLIEKAETLTARAGACRDAASQYRRDARANQESAENHKQAARTIRDANVAADHARQARDAEAEAAREILAARYYEEQAEEYEAQARSIGF